MAFDIILYFILFLSPSLIVFVYKSILWSNKSNKSSFVKFLFHEYKSVLVVSAIIIVTLFASSKLFNTPWFNNNDELIEYYQKIKDYSSIEEIYTEYVNTDSLDIESHFSKIYYHFRISDSWEVDGETHHRYDDGIAKYYNEFEDSTNKSRNDIYNLYSFLSSYYLGHDDYANNIYGSTDVSKHHHVNYYMGIINQSDYNASLKYFYKEIANKGLVKGSYNQLVKLEIFNENYNKAYWYILNEETKKHIHLRLIANVEYLNGYWVRSLLTDYYISYKETTVVGFISAFLIMLLWFIFFYRLDIYEKEKLSKLIFTFLLGALFTNVSLIFYNYAHYNLDFHINGERTNDFYYSVFGIGLFEEVVKIIPFGIVYLLWRKDFNEPYDYLLFMMVSALGFSFVENLMYFKEGVVHTISGRAVISAIGHLFFSATFAYGLILSKYRYKGKGLFIVPLFLFFAILGHGVFDFLLFFNHYIIFAFYFLIITKIFITYINNALNNSEFFDYHTKLHTKKMRRLLAIGLVIIFSLEHFYSSWYYFRNTVFGYNDGYVLSSVFVLVFLSDHFTHFDLVRGKWRVFDFSLSPFKMHTNEESFIDFEIEFIGKSKGRTMKKFFANYQKAKIIDRISIKYSSVWMKESKIIESDWFVLQLEEPIVKGNKTYTKVVVNFISKSANLFYNDEDAYLMFITDENKLANDNNREDFLLIGKINVRKIDK